MTSCAPITFCGSTKRPSAWDQAGIPIVRPYMSMCKPRGDLPWSLAGAIAGSTTPLTNRSSTPLALRWTSGAATSKARNSSLVSSKREAKGIRQIENSSRTEHRGGLSLLANLRIERVLRYRERSRALLNQIFKPLHPETADIDLAFAVDDLLRKRLREVGSTES